MKLALKYSICFLILLQFLPAQSIYTSVTHTESGEPVDFAREWKINPKGQYIDILYQNDKPFNQEIIYLLIDKKSDDSYIPFDSKAITIDPEKSWVVHNYKLTEPGEFLIYFMDSSQKRLKEESISVEYRDKYSLSANDISNVYYDNCQMLFCERVIGEKPYKVRNDLHLVNGKGTLYAFLNNYKPLNTRRLIVQVWRKDFRDFEFDDFVITKKYKVNPIWGNTFFKLTFNEPGEYKIYVYNESEALIKYNFLKIY